MSSFTIQSAEVPGSFCPITNTDWQFLVALLSGNTGDIDSNLIISKTQPDPNDQDKAWLKLNSDSTMDRIYVFANGTWISPHPVPFSSNVRQLWVGDTTSLQTFDGGEVAGVTDSTGPFWEVDTNFAGRFPLAPGTLPSGTVVAHTTTGGAETVTLNVAQIPPHTHTFSAELYPALGSGTVDEKPQSAGPGKTGSTGGGEAHNNMPPYYGAYVIRRTARKNYRGA